MKHTRKDDLDILDQSRRDAKTEEGKKHRDALLVAVYESLKDPHLEKMRIALIDALKYGNINKMNEIRKKIENYVRTPTFRKNIARKISQQVNENEAKLFYKK